MSFGNAVGRCLRNYANGAGRAGRAEYFWWFLFGVVVIVVTVVVDALVGTVVLQTVASVAVLLPSVAVGIRRLHDTDRVGWWMLLGLLPLVGAVVLLVFFLQRGTPGANRFGEPPQVAPVG